MGGRKCGSSAHRAQNFPKTKSRGEERPKKELNPPPPPGAGAEAARTAGERETKAARLERDLRSGFLAGYQTGGDPEGAELLPDSWDNALRLMTLFEAEKVFYELAYELNHRPAWVWIPMRGVAKLLV